MNPRVLELIKNPKNIQLEDLGLLKEEIHAFPYIQNIRALHLYGVHLYEKENYQKELSTTAAYTTDKKILYQLINGKIRQESKPELIEEKQPSKTADKTTRYPYKGFPIKRQETASPEKREEENSCTLQPSEDVKHIYINGERNRILFEGEENFLDEKNSDTIDLESTIESGTLVTQKSEPLVTTEPVHHITEEIQPDIEGNAGENVTPEIIINEDEISSEEQEKKIDQEEDVSFHETESLLPEVNIEGNVIEEPIKAEAVAENEELSVSDQESVISEPDAELSFHRTDEFMPDVKMQVNSEEITEFADVSQPNVNKHEDEMRRLIEEVEKKMKETKSAPQDEKEEPEIVEDHEISFAETQNFHFWSTGQEENSEPEQLTKVESSPEIEENIIENQEEVKDSQEEVSLEKEAPEKPSVWKPMSFESNMPDSLINKTVETAASVAKVSEEEEIPVVIAEVENIEPVEASADVLETTPEDILPEVAENQSENGDDTKKNSGAEVPVMNVSFFGTDISTLKVEEKEKQSKEEPVESENVQEVTMKNTRPPIDSNVPGFINTWQSWLKIDRTEDEDIGKEKEEIIEKAIETFIENNPRISQLKEESSYVVKEKNDDISHLMTETLANLYFEQKLYTKAIKAFEILIKKNPEKKKYFESKIQEIKDFRSKN